MSDTTNNNGDDIEETHDVQIIKTKPNMLKYIIQSAFGLLVLTFSIVQIMMRPDEPNQIWVGLICTIAGIFFPHPTPSGYDNTTTTTDTPPPTDIPMTTTVITTPRVRARSVQQRETGSFKKDSKKDKEILMVTI